MIEQNTVFVLGAGAHCSYGFPSGEQLIGKVVRRVAASITSHDENDIALLHHYRLAPADHLQASRFRAFVESLSNSGHASIDAFLNANRHLLGYSTIGKAAIAQVLLAYESREKILSEDDDWLAYLFKVMLDGVGSPEEFVQRNRVGFVTFNYDRFLESWLYKRIRYSFGLGEGEALEILRKIPIHHVYGSLGTFPDTNQQYNHPWTKAISGIRTIFDAEHDPVVLGAAKSLLAGAHVICLLGFGFHKENISLLELGEIAEKCPGIVASSRYEIRDAEWERLARPFKGKSIYKPQYTEKCLGALRNLPIF